MEDIFDELTNDTRYQVPAEYDFAGDLVAEIEAEYTGKNTARIDRMKERHELKKDLVDAQKKFKKIKNVKCVGNPTRRLVLNKKIAEERTKVRHNIARIKVRLDEIAIEAGEPIEAEKKDQLEELQKKNKEEAAKAKLGGWGSITPYDNDLTL